jgi:multidrug efflux pump subunit AcrA (membrane-fusion protein)
MANKKQTGKRMALLFAVLIITLTILLILFAFPDSQSIADDGPAESQAQEVSVSIFEPGDIQSEITITGRVKALQQIQLFSEVQGVLTGGDRPFRTGVRFREGEVLIRIDDTEASLALNAQRSRFLTALSGILSTLKLDYPDAYSTWAGWAEEFDPTQPLPDLPEIDDRQLRLFLTSRGIMEQYYSIHSAEFRLTKYELRAPFSGELEGADLTPGNLVQPGVRLGTFTGDNMELETFISRKDLDYIGPGDSVKLSSPAIGESIDGTIGRIGSSVDPETQAFPVYVSVSDPALKPGLYLQGTIAGQIFTDVSEIPRSLLSRSNTVLISKNGVATHKEVEPVLFQRESVIVSGITAADSLINIRAGFDALAGSEVVVTDVSN